MYYSKIVYLINLNTYFYHCLWIKSKSCSLVVDSQVSSENVKDMCYEQLNRARCKGMFFLVFWISFLFNLHSQACLNSVAWKSSIRFRSLQSKGPRPCFLIKKAHTCSNKLAIFLEAGSCGKQLHPIPCYIIQSPSPIFIIFHSQIPSIFLPFGRSVFCAALEGLPM